LIYFVSAGKFINSGDKLFKDLKILIFNEIEVCDFIIHKKKFIFAGY